MAGGRMHIPHPTPLYPPLAISYRNYQKSLAYFSHLAPLILILLLKGRVKRPKGGHGSMQPLPINTVRSCLQSYINPTTVRQAKLLMKLQWTTSYVIIIT